MTTTSNPGTHGNQHGEPTEEPHGISFGLNEIEAARSGAIAPSQTENGDELYDLRKTTSRGSRASRRMSGSLYPVDTTNSQELSSHASSRSRRYSGVAEVDAPAPVQDETQEGLSYRRSFLEDSRQEERIEDADRPAPVRLSWKERVDLFTTFCWLIFFSILGALARVGLSALTTYPGSPVAGVIWANFAGSFVMGFMAEEIRFFAAVPAQKEKTEPETSNGESDVAEDNHWSIDKKAIPLYIGITTGFCGSLTSFSSWMRDSFWAMSNTSPVHPRHRGNDVEALLAQFIATVALSVGGLKCGAHIALFLRPVIPTMPKDFRPHLDIMGMFLGISCWIGIVMMAIFVPKWRGIVLFAGVFAPIGTMMRFMASRKFNPRFPTFPLGTFMVNVGGSILDATFILLQNYGGVGVIGCQVLQGLEDGLCGCLTTVSTWVVEITSLRRMDNCSFLSLNHKLNS
ncbi:hypothetical protein TWF694_010445 [Orbilia ellipsospora]|uniref:Chromosome condensation protein n=1 Tax=Orbilia ellipsospora TaxID=2528407 RepID=A0AAV9XB24_9PEZI